MPISSRFLMGVGDLVFAGQGKRLGFVTSIQDRHGTGELFYYVRFPDRGDGYWYHPSKIKVISESR